MTSLPAMFTCSSGGQRVSYSMVCDHRPQCGDGSHESFCVFPPCSDTTTLQCGTSTQVHKREVEGGRGRERERGGGGEEKRKRGLCLYWDLYVCICLCWDLCVCIIMLVLGYVRVERHILELGSVRVHMICWDLCVCICLC